MNNHFNAVWKAIGFITLILACIALFFDFVAAKYEIDGIKEQIKQFEKSTGTKWNDVDAP